MENGQFAKKNSFYLEENINLILVCLFTHFILQSFKKFIRADPELQGNVFLGPKMTQLHRIWFFQKNLLIYFLEPFIVQTLNQILRVHPEL